MILLQTALVPPPPKFTAWTSAGRAGKKDEEELNCSRQLNNMSQNASDEERETWNTPAACF
jgi:hypothetical protein